MKTMDCWYLYGFKCDRGGICEGCPKYYDWESVPGPRSLCESCEYFKLDVSGCFYCSYCHEGTSYLPMENRCRDYKRKRD